MKEEHTVPMGSLHVAIIILYGVIATLTRDVASVVRDKASISRVDGRGRLNFLLLPENSDRLIPALGQPLLLCSMLLQCPARNDGVALAKEFAGLWHKPSVARHVVLLRMIIRHVVWGDGMLFCIGREVWLSSWCYWLQGSSVLGQCVLRSGRRVSLQFGQHPHLFHLCLVLLLVFFKS